MNNYAIPSGHSLKAKLDAGTVTAVVSHALLVSGSATVQPDSEITDLTTTSYVAILGPVTTNRTALVRDIVLHNSHVSTTSIVTLSHHDGTTDHEIARISLAAGARTVL